MLAAVFSLALAGCANLPPADSLPPLPAVARLHCCWLAEERVTLSGDQGEQVLHAVVEVSGDRLTLVMLDATGRRLLALRYDARDGLQQLTAPPSWDNLFSHYLVAAIFLHRAQPGSWLPTDSTWQVQREAGVKSLTHHGRSVIALEYPESADATGQPRRLRIPGSPHSLTVTTLSRVEL